MGGNSAYGGASTVTVTVNAKLTGCNIFGLQLLNASNGIIRDTATETNMARMYFSKSNEITSAYINDNADGYYPDFNAKDNNFTLQVFCIMVSPLELLNVMFKTYNVINYNLVS